MERLDVEEIGLEKLVKEELSGSNVKLHVREKEEA